MAPQRGRLRQMLATKQYSLKRVGGEADQMTGYCYSTEELLMSALDMLDVAAREQAKSRRKDKWLINNETLKAIRERVEEIKEQF